MSDAFERDERASAGRTLVLPNPPVALKQPMPGDHYVAPESPPSETVLATRALARQIADLMLATMPADLQQAAHDAYVSSQAAGRALNQAHAEYAALDAPPPAGMSVEQLGQRRVRKLGIADHLADLQRQQQAADQACFLALDAARHAAEYATGRTIYTDQQRQIREMREQAAALLEQADRHQIALGDAMGLIHSWLPAASGPVIPAPAAPIGPRKRLFG